MTEQTDRRDLKIQALLEKISSLTANYENQIADLRVDFTISERDKEVLQEELNLLKETDVSQEDDGTE